MADSKAVDDGPVGRSAEMIIIRNGVAVQARSH
jgi:hypothetical protein